MILNFLFVFLNNLLFFLRQGLLGLWLDLVQNGLDINTFKRQNYSFRHFILFLDGLQ